MTDAEKSAADTQLAPIEKTLNSLVMTKTALPYAYKLAGYAAAEKISRASVDPAALTDAVASVRRLFLMYCDRLHKLDPEATDRYVEDRLAFLAKLRPQPTTQVAGAPASSSVTEASAVLVKAEEQAAAGVGWASPVAARVVVGTQATHEAGIRAERGRRAQSARNEGSKRPPSAA